MKTSLEFLKEKGLTQSSHVHSMSVESFSKLMEEYAEQFKTKWIRVEDELPEFGYQYIVSLEFSEPCTVCAIFDEGQFTCAETEEVFTNVSHWMPLPEPPNT